MKIIPVLLDIRSAHNVGAIMRTAEALGCEQFITVGITPHMRQKNDKRLPHAIENTEKKIFKTALGTHVALTHLHFTEFSNALTYLHEHSYCVAAVEQDEKATHLEEFVFEENTALVFGPERTGMSEADLSMCDEIIEIPMSGSKASFNVASAAAIALYAAHRELS